MKTVLDAGNSPFAQVRPLPFGSVRWTGGFWADRLTQCREVTVKTLWELLENPEAGHVLENFRIAAGLVSGSHRGTHWQDAWLYKWIEAAACLHATSPDPWLETRMDKGIELIEAAQQPDGYIATQTTARAWKRFQDIRHHEIYTMGHLITAAVLHCRMTGKATFLTVARRVGDFLSENVGTTVEPCFAHNPSAVMGLVELYRQTGQKSYLACAQRIVDARGTKPKNAGGDIWKRPPGLAGTDQIQDRVPLRKETQVVGHNVFFTYLFAGAADVYLETGEEQLKTALQRLWENITTAKMSLNGGVSPMGRGLSPRHDILVEAVGPDYCLPNADAYNETCGQIGQLLWNARMLCADPDARYADQIEQEIYNGILPGISLEGNKWWYRNPLRRCETKHDGTGHNDLPARETPGERRICCPTNLLRTVAQWQSYMYSTHTNGIYIHQYGASETHIPLPNGEQITLRQETDYPWDGTVRITFLDAPKHPLSLHLRIPLWADGATLSTDGGETHQRTPPGKYAQLEETWKAGSRIDLHLPMPVQLIEANPRVEYCSNQVAVRRGPILYCIESTDLPDGVRVNDVILPANAHFNVIPSESLPFGTRCLQAQAFRKNAAAWTPHAYRPLAPPSLEPLTITMIPYFAWANRGPVEMTVWIPVTWPTP